MRARGDPSPPAIGSGAPSGDTSHRPPPAFSPACEPPSRCWSGAKGRVWVMGLASVSVRLSASQVARAASVPHSLHTVRGGPGVSGCGGGLAGLWTEPQQDFEAGRAEVQRGCVQRKWPACSTKRLKGGGGRVRSSQEPGPQGSSVCRFRCSCCGTTARARTAKVSMEAGRLWGQRVSAGSWRMQLEGQADGWVAGVTVCGRR